MSMLWLLCTATLCSVLNAFAQNFINFILTVTHQESAQCRKLRQGMMDIKKEMEQFSMIDEFARHARLQRKLIKLQQEWKDEASVNNGVKMQTKFVTTAVVRLLLGIFALYLVYQYQFVPVLELPTEWFSPVSSFLSWPTGKEGAISLMSWFVISGSVSRQFANLLS